VLLLAVLGVLAAAPGPAGAPVDTSLRVPGTALRFGLPDSLAAARGFAPADGGARGGPCRFFGMESDTRLVFTDGRLDRAEFTVEPASPRQRDYVQDQLAAMGYRRRCEELRPAASDCEWTGRTRVRLTITQARLRAVVTPPEPAATTVAPEPAVAAVPAAVPVLPETLGVHAPGRMRHRAPAAVRSAPRCAVPPALRPDGVPPIVRTLLLVDRDGSVLEAAVTRGIPTLDRAALECARRWRFEPRTWRGAPCRFRVEVPIDVSFD
jgi:TonB family protein